MSIEATLGPRERATIALAAMQFWLDQAAQRRRELGTHPTPYQIALLYDYLLRAEESGQQAVADLTAAGSDAAISIRERVTLISAALAEYRRRRAAQHGPQQHLAPPQ